MTDVFVTNWFTKKKGMPKKECKSLRDKICKEIQSGNTRDLTSFVEHVKKVLEETKEDLMKVPSDTRLPVCSLYHHLCTTAGIGVCLAIDNEIDDKMDLAKIRLGCLLHDIGKLDVFSSHSNFTDHPKYTEEFMKEILSNAPFSNEEKREIINLAARHHSPEYYGIYRAQSPKEKLVSRADTIASGADRSYEVKCEDDALVSEDRIFPHVFRDKNGKWVTLYPSSPSKKEKIPVAELEKNGDIIFDYIIQGGLTADSYSFSWGGKLSLLSLDIMQIQGFIKETKKLAALAGGSAIIRGIEKIARDVIEAETCPECILYSGGGNLLAILPSRKAKDIEDKIKRKIEDNWKDVRFVVKTKDFPIANMEFHEAVKEIHQEVEKAKVSMVEEIPVEKFSSGEICEYCSRRKGTKVDDNVLCEICNKKEKIGKNEMNREENEDKFYAKLKEKGKLSREMANIGQYIAVLAFDGNMIGRLFKAPSTPAGFKYKSEEFDALINEALMESAHEAINEKRELFIYRDEDKTEYVGFRKIYSGGDDILLIVNAKGALHFAKKFIEKVWERFKFESEGQEGYPKFSSGIVTMSCGIAYARHDFPVYFLIEKAEELLGKAKSEFRKKIKNEDGFLVLPKGAIAISCITSSMPEEKDFVYVLDGDAQEKEVEMLMEMIEHAQEKKGWKTLVSYLVNFENSDEGKINFVKFLYSHMDKEVIVRAKGLQEKIHVVEKLVRAIKQKDVLEHLVPMVW